MAKTAAYLVAVIVVVVFAYWYSHQHGLVSRQAPGGSRTQMVTALSLLAFSLAVVLCIGIYEVVKFVRGRAEQWIVQSSVASGPAAEFEEAQKLRAAGRPLDAIGVLREYLQANPFELHTMARIAEIYRYDLKNDLAAALEYEELLKHKLPDDQWAWAALHLAKLYGRRNELEKSLALLERLDNEYGHTVAGRRAKKALEQVSNPDAPAEEEGEETEG